MKTLLAAVPMTLALFFLSIFFGGLLALLIVWMRVAKNPILSNFAKGYIFVFRGSPLLIQMFLVFYGLGQFGFIRYSFLWPFLREPFVCAVLSLALCTAGYTAEIFRGGLRAVSVKEIEAARSIGMSGFLLVRRIIGPIAFRHALPAYSTEIVMMVKSTALASLVTVWEVTGVAQRLISQTYRTMEVPWRCWNTGFPTIGALFRVCRKEPCIMVHEHSADPAAATVNRLSVRNIRKKFGSLEVLRGISLEAHDGDVISILGSSGSGKSTFLRCINLLEIADEGEIWVDGEHINMVRKHGRNVPASSKQVDHIRAELGMVFQSFNLWSHMTILQNLIEGPVHVLKRPRAECIAEAEALLEKVGIAEKLLRVMRSLAEEGMTMLVVTHEMNFARDVSNRVVFMREGLIDCDGSPAEMFSGATSPAFRQFIGNFRGFPPDEYGIHGKSGYRFGIPVADDECGTDKTLQSFPFRIVVVRDFQRACRLVQRLLHEFAVGR
eukprot:gene7180-8842_t